EFDDSRHRTILEAIRTLHAEKKRADLVTVLEWLTGKNLLAGAGGPGYVTQIVDTACFNGAHQFDSYLRTLRERANPERGATEGNEACASEAGLSVGASPTRRIGLFTTEHDLNSVA